MEWKTFLNYYQEYLEAPRGFGPINDSTLILHGIHDKVVLFPLAKVHKQSIRNSKLVSFKFSGHGLFYDEKNRFNEELVKFIEE